MCKPPTVKTKNIDLSYKNKIKIFKHIQGVFFFLTHAVMLMKEYLNKPFSIVILNQLEFSSFNVCNLKNYFTLIIECFTSVHVCVCVRNECKDPHCEEKCIDLQTEKPNFT